jgi:hypothetical protein
VADRRRDAQLELFTNTRQGDRRNAPVEPVDVGEEVARLADRFALAAAIVRAAKT